VRAIDYLATRSAFGALAFLAMAFAGCTTYAPVMEPAIEDPAVVTATPDPVVTPLPDPEPAVAVPAPPRLPPVAIVITNSQAAYLDVAVELAGYFEDHALYDLGDESLPPGTVLRSINDSDATVVIAIGLRAAQSSVAMSDVPVVFSQVFNHKDHELLADNSRGVAAIAPLAAQLDAWKKINPALGRIGLIIGTGHDDLVADAELAALQHDIDLEVRIAHSDQETLYLFRRMIRDIDGFWLFPDNRILSTRVLNKMLVDANRQRVAVVAPNEAMLQMGAAISMSTLAGDIAAKVAGIVRRIQAGEIKKVPAMTALSEVRVAINDKAPTRHTVASVSASP
jgi:ABC-type uncharacterized transport system substrate-binding protein